MSARGLLTGGRWLKSAETAAVEDKYLGGPYAEVSVSDAAQVSAAVEAADEAFRTRPLTPDERAAILTKAAGLLAERRERAAREHAKQAMREMDDLVLQRRQSSNTK